MAAIVNWDAKVVSMTTLWPLTALNIIQTVFTKAESDPYHATILFNKEMRTCGIL